MASGNNLMEKLQDEVSCSICLEYLRDPVTIDCGHNFCCVCITDYCERWEGSTTGVFFCPQCRAGFLQTTFRPNKQLANIVEGIEQLALQPDKEPKEKLCEKHGKKLRLFCEDDGEAICLVCDKSRVHRSHTVIPIEEAAQDYKDKVRAQREVIVAAFAKRRQALEEEELLLVSRLEEEEEETLQKLQKNAAFLVEQSSSLAQLITEIEQKCQQPAADLLKDVKSTLIRSHSVKLQKPEVIHTELQDSYEVPRVRETLQKYRVDVTLDPNTANAYLLLSQDRRSVRVGDKRQDVPSNPERFDTCTCVLGWQRFTTGRHYWEVEVGDKTCWTLGVCEERVSRQGIFTPSPATGFWTVWLRNGDEYAALTSPLTELTLKVKPWQIGILLDYEAGEVSFYNVTGSSHIYTFSDTFSEPLRPYFYPGVRAGGLNDAPLTLQPGTQQP
ncbi:E3 ubiquitin-protein ligase TRIM39-like isoform X2 [Trachemys scripta elegans]|uniref:E3 ubiquitin-protein ligase TRIM39-like isoform X2 n=1 Tax=Trachemys scripta elegans TaxID=31138 RepID=UPI00155332C0|nr:E3 ubiquitin-protein ligase TRIM39-like isoform X2 [Trachemys scripta elegans]